MIKGKSGHYYLRDRLAEVIDEKMNENKDKLEEAERQAEITEMSKTKISVKKVNQLPKLKIKTFKSKKPSEEIPIIREPRQIGEGNENFEDKTLLKIEDVAAAEPAVAIAPIFRPFAPLRLTVIFIFNLLRFTKKQKIIKFFFFLRNRQMLELLLFLFLFQFRLLFLFQLFLLYLDLLLHSD